MAGFRQYVIGTIVTIMSVFFIFAFIGNFLGQTNPDSEILDSKYGINQTSSQAHTRLNNIANQVNQTSSQFGSATVDPVAYLFLISKAMFEIPIQIFLFVSEGITSLPLILFKGLGGTGGGDLLSMAISLIISIMIITLVLLGVKYIRTGESER